MILPDRVFGRPATGMSKSGVAKGPIAERTAPLSSFNNSGDSVTPLVSSR